MSPREDFFDSHEATAATVHAPHGVQKEDEKTPQGNELKVPFGELIVTRCRLMTARTDCGGALTRPHRNLDTLVVWTEAGVMVDKAAEAVASIKNRDQFHGPVASGVETSTVESPMPLFKDPATALS
jgi:hypothetical protein